MGTQRIARRYSTVALALIAFSAFFAALQVFRHMPIKSTLSPGHYGGLFGFGSSSRWSGSQQTGQVYSEDPSDYTTTVVLGRLNQDRESTFWVDEKLKGITNKAVYVVDDTHAPLHLPENHGREAMVYLKYILENYDNLTDITFFWHSHGKAWHNNLLLREDSAATINMMRRPYIMEKGYVNSRCDTSPGCPKWIKFDPTPGDHTSHSLRLADMFTPERWAALFPEADEMPRYLSAPCCSQFAVTRDIIRRKPKYIYKRLHDWIASESFDMYSGRFMEYTWQYLFLGKEEVCPNTKDCYCKLYGLCFEDDGLLERWQSHVYRADELGDQLYNIDEGLKSFDKDFEVSTDSSHQAVAGRLVTYESKAEELRKTAFNRFAIPSWREF